MELIPVPPNVIYDKPAFRLLDMEGKSRLDHFDGQEHRPIMQPDGRTPVSYVFHAIQNAHEQPGVNRDAKDQPSKAKALLEGALVQAYICRCGVFTMAGLPSEGVV